MGHGHAMRRHVDRSPAEDARRRGGRTGGSRLLRVNRLARRGALALDAGPGRHGRNHAGPERLTSARPSQLKALALALAKSSYGPDGKRLFLKPSDSKNGWLGVSSTHAAHDALPDGIALEGEDEHAIQY